VTTPLEKDLRRALKINGADYVLTISPTGLKLTLKKKRNGLELAWVDLVSGEAALATALNASLGRLGEETPAKGATALKGSLGRSEDGAPARGATSSNASSGRIEDAPAAKRVKTAAAPLKRKGKGAGAAGRSRRASKRG